jgi:hypothetical protein
MKNLLFFSVLLVSVLGKSDIALGQRRFIVKMDALEASQKHLLTGFEWRLNNTGSLELQFGYRGPTPQAEYLFNGDWTTQYAKRRSYIVQQNSSVLKDDTGWQYLGTGRPLPASVGTALYQYSTLYGRLGFVKSFQEKPRGIRLLFVPGITFAKHRYYEISEQIVQENVTDMSWRLGALPYESQMVEKTEYYTETRKMREHHHATLGASYAFGFAWQTKFGLYLEARATIGVNFSKPPYEVVNPPEILKNFYGQAAFMAGWAF